MLERSELARFPVVALRELPKSPNGVILAGDILTGVNYSSVYKDNNAAAYVKENSRLVGTGTSLSTYYSSLENPASIMYTSGDVDPTHTSWSSYYGMDCSGFVSYALGFGEWVWTMKLGGQETDSHKAFFSKYIEVVLDGSDTDLSKVRRGDMLVNTLHNDEIKANNADFTFKNHVILIKDVIYDNDGALLGFDLVESTTPFVRASFETPDTIKSRMENTQPYSVIRAKPDLLRLLDVEQVEYSKSIYPDKGDGGKYEVNEPVWLYIPDTSATAVIYNGTKILLSSMEANIVNGVTVYKLELDQRKDTHIIAADTALDDPCNVKIKAVG
jgi:hypothetical protein